MGVALQEYLAWAKESGVWTNKGVVIRVGFKLPFFTKLRVVKQWVAPESNRVVAGTELTRNVPSMTLGASSASSA